MRQKILTVISFFVLGGVLKITQGDTVLRIGRSMVIVPLGCLND